MKIGASHAEAKGKTCETVAGKMCVTYGPCTSLPCFCLKRAR